MLSDLIEKANSEAIERINNSQPFLVDMKYAKDILGLDKKTILHAGPPIRWENMCGPMQGAIVGVIRYEGLAETEEEAWNMASGGKIQFQPNHDLGAVGPMTGIISHSMPLFEIINKTYGNKAYTTINEGLGKVLRFGANNNEVLERLKWLEKEFAPIMKKALSLSGEINLKVLTAKALTMGDEMHQRNVAVSLVFAAKIMPYIVRSTTETTKLARVVEFLTSNEQFFLNLVMAAGKATMDTVKNIDNCSIVTAMSRNGRNFGIRVSALGDKWFEAPTGKPKGLYFPGFSEDDANPDMGDSAIVETMGLGGFAMASSPAVVNFVGAGTIQDALNFSKEMYAIGYGKSTDYLMPALNFQGVSTGIDIRKVVDTGILPVINTGIAHKKPGIGQVGAGVISPPMDCFIQAIKAFAAQLGI